MSALDDQIRVASGEVAALNEQRKKVEAEIAEERKAIEPAPDCYGC